MPEIDSMELALRTTYDRTSFERARAWAFGPLGLGKKLDLECRGYEQVVVHALMQIAPRNLSLYVLTSIFHPTAL